MVDRAKSCIVFLQISRDFESKTWSLTVAEEEIVSDGSGVKGEGYAARVFSFGVSYVGVFLILFFIYWYCADVENCGSSSN